MISLDPCRLEGVLADILRVGARVGHGGRAVALDANGCFSRPGPRLVDGVERLARLLG